MYRHRCPGERTESGCRPTRRESARIGMISASVGNLTGGARGIAADAAAVYWDALREPSGEPPMGCPSGIGRPAVKKPALNNSALTRRNWLKLSG